jgi:hypothetical protein
MEEKFEIFALINLFGHNQLAGKVTVLPLGAATLLRVDVPKTKLIPEFTRFINPTAIYSMDPVTEELMQARAEMIKAQPIDVYDIRAVVKNLKELSAGGREFDEDNGNF